LEGDLVAVEVGLDSVYIALLAEEDHRGSRRVVEALAVERNPAAKNHHAGMYDCVRGELRTPYGC
jgi:hypothetical protein